MAHDGFPPALEDVTPAWLTRTLREAGTIGDAAVTAVAIEPIGRVQGFMGRVVRLSLSYDADAPGAPRSLVAKFTGGADAIREARFYTELATDWPTPTPRLYGREVDDAAGTTILLLEDLGHLRRIDFVAGCTEVDAFLVAAHLARWHAVWWDSPRLADLVWLPLTDDNAELIEENLRPKVPAFRERLGDLASPELLDGITAFVDHVAAIRHRLAGPPRTILHGDFRQDNLFFADRAGAPPVTVVDWGSCGRGLGVVDLAYFAAMSLEPAPRRAIEREMVERYHQALVAQGVNDYGIERCWEDYRIAALHVVERWVLAGAVLDFQASRTPRAVLQAWLRRCEALLEDYHVDELLPAGGG